MDFEDIKFGKDNGYSPTKGVPSRQFLDQNQLKQQKYQYFLNPPCSSELL